jgi:hypothetical protein
VTASITEKQFLQQVCDLAQYTGWSAYHTHDSRRSEPGFPDLVLANPKQQRVVYAELKAQRGRVSEDQRRWLDMLEDCGAEVALWRPADMPVIEAVLKGQRIGGVA